jgi:hypothetical protein
VAKPLQDPAFPNGEGRMALLEWFNLKRREMDFIYSRASELRARYGAEAEEWCEARLLSTNERRELRALKQLRKALKHIR